MIKKVIRPIIKGLKYSFKDFLNKEFGLYKIEVINLNAIDICNSKCQMCNIWQQQIDEKISPENFGLILRDKLFKDVKSIGVTGGEPTLREDLVQLFESILSNSRKLKGISIITNGIKHDDILTKCIELNELCKSYHVQFHVMVSIDGVGCVHDEIRGVPGNFESSLKLINKLREHQIPVNIGTTISKNNVWDMEEMLAFLKRENIYGRFRVAEYIDRLYNNDLNVIRNFDADEKYQLSIFFHKLERLYENESIFKRTYQSIRNILQGGKRTIGCPYHASGVVLNDKGEISYCAPKSAIIGNALESSALKIYNGSLEILNNIKSQNCDNCIHDYHYPDTLKQLLESSKEKVLRKLFTIKFYPVLKLISFFMSLSPSVKDKDNVLIVGWYGTETVGDKAILAGIIEDLKSKNDKTSITIASIYPYVTERTCRELGIKARIINAKSFELIKASSQASKVIMGGGPLMDIEELIIPELSFKIARKGLAETIVYGCGWGPFRNKKYEKHAYNILNLSSSIMLRDQASKVSVSSNINKYIQVIDDPARGYLGRNYSNNNKTSSKVLSVFLRELPFNYSHCSTQDEFNELKLEFEEGLAKFIKSKMQDFEILKFDHMHNFFSGNDDREFSYYFVNKYLKDAGFKIEINKKLSTVDSVVNTINSSGLCICMRFHSVLFAETLNANFLAVDYTMGGKIKNYLDEKGKLERYLTTNDIARFVDE